MSHEVTANKYRPQDFESLSGQNLVSSAIKNLLDKKNIPNAFLLSGPRGVGKTSTARIIAKGLNCKNGPTGTPCNTCENCITIKNGNNQDVIEIDGASNTSINDIKIIQEEIQYPPINSNYKIYIIDEVHMLSKSAFNALLKTIEEPPEYVVFIFATTEINQVPATIRSRCQQYNLRLLPTELIVENLKKVLKDKKISYEENALLWIANEGKGSMRDSFTILDQIIAFCENEITLEKIYKKMGITSNNLIIKLLKDIINNDLKSVFATYFQIIETGIQHEQLLIDIIKTLRDILFIKFKLEKNIINPSIYEDEIIKSLSIYDIENLLEISYTFFEKMKFSINLSLDFELYLIKISNFKNFIRPIQIINELNKIKNNIISANIKNDLDTKNNNQDEKKKLINNNQQIINNNDSHFKNNSNTNLNDEEKKLQKNKKIEQEENSNIKNIKILNDTNENINLNSEVIYKILEHSNNIELSKLINEVDLIEINGNNINFYIKKAIYYELLKNNINNIKKEIFSVYKNNFNIGVYLENKTNNDIFSTNKEKIISIFNGYEI